MQSFQLYFFQPASVDPLHITPQPSDFQKADVSLSHETSIISFFEVSSVRNFYHHSFSNDIAKSGSLPILAG